MPEFVTLQPAVAADRAALLALTSRLAEFPHPSARSRPRP